MLTSKVKINLRAKQAGNGWENIVIMQDKKPTKKTNEVNRLKVSLRRSIFLYVCVCVGFKRLYSRGNIYRDGNL